LVLKTFQEFSRNIGAAFGPKKGAPKYLLNKKNCPKWVPRGGQKWSTKTTQKQDVFECHSEGMPGPISAILGAEMEPEKRQRGRTKTTASGKWHFPE
jgi:hypothetical protein